MPIHEYQCKECSHSFEKLIFKGDDEQIYCSKCGDFLSYDGKKLKSEACGNIETRKISSSYGVINLQMEGKS